MSEPLRLPHAIPFLSPGVRYNEPMYDDTPESNLPPGLLAKVRALLAKAESTSFEAEADAFTAKAQELMTRYRIDQAVLASDRSNAAEPGRRTIVIDAPYIQPKVVLLGTIARANGGESIWTHGAEDFCTLFAQPEELDIIEDLFTSLLVQATVALRREGPKRDAWGRSRTRRFRWSFLLSFAARIGQRLQETVDQVVAEAEAETGTALVPLLADRAEAARRAAQETFGSVRSYRPSVSDREGWHAGRIFGDRADISTGPSVSDRAAS